jgi:hypothetical protein
MLKRLLLIPILLIITGCGSKYEIEFTENNTIKDTINIFEDNKIVKNYSKEDEDKLLNQILDFERGYEHYKRELYTTEKVTGYKYTYEFKFEEYDALSQLRKCYEDLILEENDKEIKLTTKGEFLCKTYHKEMPYIDINIKSNYKIKETNGKTKDNNVVTWRIDKNNYKNSPIQITYNKKELIEKEKKSKAGIIIRIILFIGAVVFVIINRKKFTKKA